MLSENCIVELLKDKEKNNYIIVKVKWNDEAVQSVGEEITDVKLKKSTWTPEEHGDGSWIEDLHHMAMSTEDISNFEF